eukprot:Rmarinus@m.13443
MRAPLQHTWRSLSSPPESFKVMSWNVLADGLAQFGKFDKCDPEFLSLSHRAPLVLRAIKSNAPDILALVELNWFNELANDLRHLGYHGEFLPKYQSPALHHGGTSDGVALFFKKDRFRMPGVLKTHYTTKEGETASSGYIIANLFDTKANKSFVVVVSHLKAKPQFEDVRVEQAYQMLNAVHFFDSTLSLPIICCGDFNTEPQSSTFEVFSRGVGKMSLKWAYEGQDLKYTTWKHRSTEGDVKHIIDYIFHSPQLSVSAVLDVPEETTVPDNRFPNSVFPSDHVAVGCEFYWK